ncbi:MAG: hypothetical protein NTZ24_14970 [Deltaproteobacteria bacterium]|nr:hypothetical protein [Deltaproteobacteria bacterium]
MTTDTSEKGLERLICTALERKRLRKGEKRGRIKKYLALRTHKGYNCTHHEYST